ncbi:MAG: ATP-binding cassette domain-containing protein [Candidatus Limnocylindrales bacterium]
MTPADGASGAAETASRTAERGPEPAAVVQRPAGAGSATAIRTVALGKRFGSVTALRSLDLQVPAGSIFGFLGPNGAGKTTTLRLLTGLAHATQGTATVDGIPIGADDGRLQRRIGYLDQDPRFYGWMRGGELLEMVARLHGLSSAEARRRVADVLEIIGLVEAARRRIGTYSGGMRQRLGIGQAIVNRPSVLFLDEPVSSLDPEGRRDVLEIIERLRGTATVVLCTHILTDVERVCDRVAILNFGSLVIEAPMDELLERHALPVYHIDPEPGQPDALARLTDALRGQPWVRDVRVEHGLLRVFVRDPGVAGPALLPVLAGTGVTLASFERARPSLEDVFLHLVANGDRPVGDTPSSWPERPAGTRRPAAGSAGWPTTPGSGPSSVPEPPSPPVPSSWPEPPGR